MFNFFKSKKEGEEVITPLMVHVNGQFDLSALHSQLKDHFKDQESSIESEQDDCCLKLKTNVIKDDKQESFIAYEISEQGASLEIKCQKFSKDLATEEETWKEVDLYRRKNEIVGLILEHSNELLDDGFFLKHQKSKMDFVSAIKALECNFILKQLKENEIVLSCLGISNLKSELFEVDKEKSYYFILSSERNLILGTDGKNFTLDDITGKDLEYKEKFGKNGLSNQNFSFSTELLNDYLFTKQKALFNKGPERRIESFGDVLFSKYNAKEEHFNFIDKIYSYKTSSTDELRRKLKSYLMDHFTNLKCAKEFDADDEFMHLLFNNSDFGEQLCELMDDWKISAEEQYFFLVFLLESNDNFKLKNVDAFYERAIAGVANQKKPPQNIEAARLKHLQYLKETKQFEKAISLYEMTLENLEDDSILELISDTKTNVLNGEDCHPLRIQLLEDLSEIKTGLKEADSKELLELARLQPLVLRRLSDLLADKSTNITDQKNASEILSVLMAGFLESAESKPEISLDEKSFDKSELYERVVPECFKEAESWMDSFTKLIAKADPPDYNLVTKFSEKLTADKFPEAFEVLQELSRQMQLKEVECYIGNGEFSKGIIGIEGKPDFLIIGVDHLNPDSQFYFTRNEMKFSMAIELTHILFEHTKITSKDVWRGAKSKGKDFAGVLLVALPILGTVGSLAGRFFNISRFGKLLSGLDLFGKVIDKGQTAAEYGGKLSDKFIKEQKESEMLATSRLMEISADRVGLLMTNDLRSSINVLLKTNDDFLANKDSIQEKGLHDYLMEQNEKGEFIRQELIIRIKTLCSFYLHGMEASA